MDCDAENPKKKQKLKRDIDSNILDQFWDLVDASDDKRLRAAEQLLATLLLKQPPVNIQFSQHYTLQVRQSDREVLWQLQSRKWNLWFTLLRSPTVEILFTKTTGPKVGLRDTIESLKPNVDLYFAWIRRYKVMFTLLVLK